MSRITEFRKAAGMSQGELAKRLGVTQGAVSQWEKGYSNPRLPMLMKMATVLGVTLDSLTGGGDAVPDNPADS